MPSTARPPALEFAGAVSTGQSVLLKSGGLAIDDPAKFFATIHDFNAADTITLRGVDVASATYDNGALRLNGGAAGTLHFRGRFTTDQFSAVCDPSANATTITLKAKQEPRVPTGFDRSPQPPDP